MAVYQLNKIQSDVRIALDENKTSEVLSALGDVDTLALNDIIISKVEEAVQRIHSTAQAHLLDGGYNFGEQLYWNADQKSGWVFVPEDFMRFVVFQMSDWERPVYYPISVDDPEYALQSSRFGGVRGNPQRPVCAIAIRPEGRVLEFYSCKSNLATVSRGIYLPFPKIDAHDAIMICERCYTAVVYTIAALTLITFGETEKSTVLTELADSLVK